jgi:hypothetical protein
VKNQFSFQFITTTGEEAVGKSDVVTRRLVRAQARRQAHRNSIGISPSSTYTEDISSNGDSPLQSPKVHLSRFKLASWHRKKKAKRITHSTESEKSLPETTNLSLSTYESSALKLYAEMGSINVLPIPLNAATENLLYFCTYFPTPLDCTKLKRESNRERFRSFRVSH